MAGDVSPLRGVDREVLLHMAVKVDPHIGDPKHLLTAMGPQVIGRLC